MGFIFNTANTNINNGSLDILNGQFYIYIVTSTPNQTFNTVSELTLATNSIPTLLTNNSTTTIWNFNNIILPLTSYPIAPMGFVISKRIGSVISNTDPVIYYSEFTNSIGQTINYTTGLYRINIEFNSNGLIYFDVTNEYFAGAYVNNEAVPKGMIYLLGTNNNTTTYTNPGNSGKVICRFKFGTTTGVSGTSDLDRIATNFGGTNISRKTFDFGATRKIRMGTFAFYTNQTNTNPVSIYGSNSLTSFTDSEIDIDGYWTLLGTLNTLTANNWMFINNTSGNNSYWRWIKLETNNKASTVDWGEMELYNCSIITSSVNLV